MGAHVRGEILKVQDRVTERFEIEEMPDGGYTFRHIAVAERRVYAAIFDSLYLSAIDSPEDAADEEPTTADRCIDQCCQACACEFRSIRGCKPQNFLHQDEVVTPTLRRGREKGWGMLFEFTFPLVTNVIRDIWVTTEFIFTIIATVLSSIMFTLGNAASFNLVHLVLASVSFVLATLDFGINLYDRCKECYRGCRGVETGENGNSTEGRAKGIGKCLRYCKNTLDFLRTWIAELILYPLLICDMLEFITGQGWKNESATDRLGFALFVISSGALVAYVYIVRLLILFGMIYHVQKGRKSKESEGGDVQIYSASAFWFQFYFYIHVFGQMLVQILMIIGIGAKIQFDNPQPNTTVILANDTAGNDTITPIHISPLLWYMIVSSYILPFFGLLTFFIVMYYWVQEFPIGVCLDVLRLLIPTTGSADTFRNIKGETKAMSEKIKKIMRYVHYADLENDFQDMRGKRFKEKFAYPFKSPVLVVLCIAYFACQVAFAVCAVSTNEVELNEFGNEVPKYDFLNNGSWDSFYKAAVFLGILANLYTFLVACVWLVIIAVLILFMFLFIFSLCAGDSSNR